MTSDVNYRFDLSRALRMTLARLARLALYSCFDLVLRSEIPLTELSEALRAPDPAKIVQVSLGQVPESLTGTPASPHQPQVAGNDVLVTVPAVGRYLVRGTREIIIDPHPGGSERDLRLFLLGSVLGILCHRRGLLLLHANAIVSGGEAVAFAGPSGAGKSTLAAYFQNKGYEVLCDDLCAIGFDETGCPIVWPGLPRLKLWKEAAIRFGLDMVESHRVANGRDKYHVPMTEPGLPRGVPLRRLYVLSKATQPGSGEILPLRGARAMEAVLTQTYRGSYLPALGLGAQHFARCRALCAHIDAFDASRSWGYEVFDREADRLERHLADRAN